MDLGYHPIALHGVKYGACTCFDSSACPSAGKHPIRSRWQAATLDAGALLAELEARPELNVGWRMGPQPCGENIMAVDDDGDLEALELELGKLPPTLQQQTPSGGTHRFFRVPVEARISNRVKIAGHAVDIRSAGGQVVFCPSQTPAGSYLLTHPRRIADLPPPWLAAIAASEEVTTPADLSGWTLRGVRHQDQRVLAYCRRKAELDPSIQGDHGSAALTRWAGAVFWKLGLSDADGLPLLREMNRIGASPPWSDAELRHAMLNGMRPHESRPERRGHLLEEWAEAETRRERSLHPQCSVAAAPTADVDGREPDNHQPGTTIAAADVRVAGLQANATTIAPGTWSGARPGGSLKLTDLGNAERFVSRFGSRVRYCPQRRAWLVWDGTRWAWDETDEVMRFAKATVRGIYEEAANAASKEGAAEIAEHAIESERAARLQAMVRLAASEAGIPVVPTQLDADPWKLNVKNGTIDLKTGALSPHDPKDLITKLIPIDYDPAAQLDLWDRFTDEVTGGDQDLAAFLQRFAGYCATGLQVEKQFFFIYGRKSDTGKSTFADALRAALGDYAVDADFETWLEQSATGGNRGDLARLAGARLVISVEVRRLAKFNTMLMKRVTGGDPLTCAAKYEKEFTYRPQFKILLAANDAPRIRDDDRPMFERCLRIPFDVQVAPGRKSPELKRRLSDPADGGPAVLRWIVEGCLAWQQDGLVIPRAVRQSSRHYLQEMSTFAQFLEDACVLDSVAQVSKQDLRGAYEVWCREAGAVPLGLREVAERLELVGVSSGKATGGLRVWRGIRLRDVENEDELASGTSGTSGADARNFPHEVRMKESLGKSATGATGATHNGASDQRGWS